MNWLYYILIFIGSYFFMEFAAWFVHKYVMHGVLWFLHEDHHKHGKEQGFFEKNDAFFIIFAVPSWLCIMLGMMNFNYYVVSIGAGIAAYGLSYFLVHEVFIHQRFKWLRNTNNAYFRAIRKAHKVHHKHLTKEDGECFGMLVVPKKYWDEANDSLNSNKTSIL